LEIVTGKVTVLTPNNFPATPEGFATQEGWGALMMHEFGHIVGLGHPLASDQVMSANLAANVPGPAAYQAGDLAGLHQVGGSQSCLPAVPVRSGLTD
jgi:hypothetical protein